MAACPCCGRTTGPDLLLHHKTGCREAARWPADRVQPEPAERKDHARGH